MESLEGVSIGIISVVWAHARRLLDEFLNGQKDLGSGLLTVTKDTKVVDLTTE